MHRRNPLVSWFMASTLCVLTVVGAAGISRQTPEGPRPTLTVSLPPDQEVGIIVQDVTPPIASAFSLKEDHGAVVTALDIGTLQAGDVILSVNGQNVSSRRSLEMALAGISPSDALIFQVSRNGGTREIVIQRPGSTAAPSEEQTIPAAIAPGFRGVQIDGLGVGLSQYNGITVTKVDRGTPAEAAGLALGDIIVDVNQLPVASVDQFFGYLEKLSGQRLNLGVMRQGIYIVVVVPSFY